MRVLHLIKTGTGGTWALLQIEQLVKAGVEVHVALGEDGPMKNRYLEVGASVHRVDIDVARIGLLGFLGARKRFLTLVNELQPDLIHSHFVTSTLFMRVALRNVSSIPRVFQVPGPLHLEKALVKWLEILSATENDYWIASCRKTAELYLDAGVSAERVALSYYGTKFSNPPTKNAEVRIRSELGLDSDVFIVGMVAYMYAPRRWLGQKAGIKGHEDLVDALSILEKEGLNVVGVFVGGAWNQQGWYERELREYGEKKVGSRAIFLGNRSDVADLYQAFDLVVHPSHTENVGGAGESMMLGVPTVATNVGGFPDVVVDGQTGRLVPPQSPKALAQAISSTMENPKNAARMALNGKEHVLRLFDIERTGAEIFELYKKYISRNSKEY